MTFNKKNNRYHKYFITQKYKIKHKFINFWSNRLNSLFRRKNGIAQNAIYYWVKKITILHIAFQKKIKRKIR
jgi:hypothetical protein